MLRTISIQIVFDECHVFHQSDSAKIKYNLRADDSDSLVHILHIIYDILHSIHVTRIITIDDNVDAEYAYTTKVNEKIDVYSFGVVLLELVTGREPNCGDEHTSLAEWAWKHCGEGREMGDAIDREIKEGGYLEEMINVYKLGLMCTSPLPTSRPSMKEVVQILQRCSSADGGGDQVKKAGKDYDVAPLLGRDKYISSYRCNSKKLMDQSDSSLVSLV